MTSFEWFLLIVIVIVVPLIIAVVVTLWTIDQANKRKRANRNDPQIGVKRKAALDPDEVAARKAARAERDAAAEAAGTIHPDTDTAQVVTAAAPSSLQPQATVSEDSSPDTARA